jgi:hypothetical protein
MPPLQQSLLFLLLALTLTLQLVTAPLAHLHLPPAAGGFVEDVELGAACMGDPAHCPIF